MNFYKHYIGDFQRDTGHLSLTERGAYLALMHHYYATEQALPVDHAALCRIAGAFSKPERDAVKAVMRFFEVRDGQLWHKRIEAELEKQEGRADTNRRIALAREERKRAEKEPRSDHEQSTNRAPNVQRSVAPDEHEQSTPQNQSQNQERNTVPDGTVVGGEPPDPASPPASTVRSMPLPCPKERIAERFSEALPMLPRVKLWPKARESAIRSRWGEMLREKRWQTADEGVRWFDEFFRHAAKSDFITGRRRSSGAHAGWSADFDFLISPKGFTGVREGKYDNQEATA